MKIKLNISKTPFCMIGDNFFNLDNLELDIDVKNLPDIYKNQFLYNVNRGCLLVEDLDEFIKLIHLDDIDLEDLPEEQEKEDLELSIVEEAQLTKKVVNQLDKKIENEEKFLRDLLKSNSSSIKRMIKKLELSKIKKLLEMEKKTKNRKGLVTLFSDLIQKHEGEVKTSIDRLANKKVKRSSNASKYVSEIEESEVQTLILSKDAIEQLEV